MQALKLAQVDGRLTPVLDEQYPPPQAGPGEVVLRPLRMGVCSTDLELCKGYMGYQGVLGHEFVGDVVEAYEE